MCVCVDVLFYCLYITVIILFLLTIFSYMPGFCYAHAHNNEH